MSTRTIVITGASDGIGAAAARRLRAEGANVVLVGRSPVKTAAVATEIGAPYYVADFSDLAQVHDLATTLLNAHPRIDVLANNAGGIMGDRTLTADGFEKTFQVNHLAPFLLTHLLMPVLLSSGAAVLQTSSIAAQRYGNIDLEDLQNEKTYSPNKAYGDSKLENILFTKELDRRYRAQGLNAVAFHPGNVASNFASDTTSMLRFAYRTPLKHIVLISSDKSAKTLTWLADGVPGTTWEPGQYYEKRKVATTSPQAADSVLAKGLWERSSDLLGLGARS